MSSVANNNIYDDKLEMHGAISKIAKLCGPVEIARNQLFVIDAKIWRDVSSNYRRLCRISKLRNWLLSWRSLVADYVESSYPSTTSPHILD